MVEYSVKGVRKKMPKKISIIEKREWLRLYEEGMSVASICKKANRNVKTVKLGIEDARRERDAQLGRSEIIKDALWNHQKQLLAIVNDILSAVHVPPISFDMKLPISLFGATVMHEEMKGPVLTLVVEDKLEWELLIEHLGKGDPLWDLLGQWKKVMIEYMQIQRELRIKAETVIEIRIGHKLTKGPTAPPFVYSSAAVLLHAEALHIALETPPTSSLQECITVNADSGEIMYELDRVLAKVPGEEDKYMRNILSAFIDLQTSDELERAGRTYKKVGEATTKLRRVAEEIRLLGVVPGQCRVCRRLGV